MSRATRAPQPPPTAPGTTGIETPCDLGHGDAVRQRQIGFLKWSPDGSSLVFDVDLTSIEAIWEVGVDGSYARKLATPNPLLEYQSKYGFQPDLSPDGRYVVYSTCGYEENADWRGCSTLLPPVYTSASQAGSGDLSRAGGRSGISKVCSARWNAKTAANWRSVRAPPLSTGCSVCCPVTSGTRTWSGMI